MIRIQDTQGRGPWRPGFSKRWIDLESEKPLMPPIFQEFPNIHSVMSKAHDEGYHMGCAFIDWEGVERWLMPHEIEKVLTLGFDFYDAHKCRVLVKSENQAVIASRMPLAWLPKARRKACA